MSLVGDVIVRFRNAARDQPGTLAQPAAPNLTAGGGGSLPAGKIYFVLTWLTQWGETLPSAEANVTVGANGTLSGTLTPPPAATAGRLYYGITPGGENQYITVNLSGVTTITSLTAGTGSIPPTRNRAWLPDSDGIINAYQAYDWLNGALLKLGLYSGGVLDETGVAVAPGSAELVIPGWWLYLTDFWHNGWVVLPQRAEFTWMKSTLSGIPGIVTTWQSGAKQVLGLWPQPSDNFVTTTLSAPIGATDATFPVASSAGFIAPGLAQVDNEVFSFASVGGSLGLSLGNIVRGLGGTQPVAHLINATVTWLIFRFRGFRMPITYSVGQSGMSMDLPPSWDQPLHLYMLARFKEYEQDDEGAAAKDADFVAKCKEVGVMQDDPTGPRQLGYYGAGFGTTADELAAFMDTVLVP